MGNPWRQVQWTNIVKVWLLKGTGTSYLPSEPTPSNLLAYYQQTQWTSIIKVWLHIGADTSYLPLQSWCHTGGGMSYLIVSV